MTAQIIPFPGKRKARKPRRPVPEAEAEERLTRRLNEAADAWIAWRQRNVLSESTIDAIMADVRKATKGLL